MSTDESPDPVAPPPIEFEANPPSAQVQVTQAPAPAPSPPIEPAPTTPSVPLPLDTVPVSPPATPSTPAPPAPASSFSPREAAIQMGYDAETVNRFESDEAFFGGVMNALGQAGEDRQYADIGRQVAPKWDEVQKILTTPSEPAAPAVPEVDPWPSCARDPAYDKLPRDAQGNYLYNDVTEAKLASEANAGRTLRRGRLDGLANDPVELIRRAGLDKYLDERDERMRAERRGELEALDVAAVQRAHFQEHLTEYCQLDGQGNLARDPRNNNNFILSLKGQAYEHYLNQGLKEFQNPPAQAHQYAVRQVEAETALGTFGPTQPGQSQVAQAQPGQAQPVPPPNTAAMSPASVGQQKQDSFLDQAQASLQQAPPGTSTTNRDGTFPGSDALAPLQNADEPVKEMANDVLTRAGHPTQ